MKTTLRALTLTVLATLALTGCFKVQMDVTLRSDNTVDGTTLFALQEGSGESTGTSDEEAVNDLFGVEDALGSYTNATAEAYKEDGYVGQVINFTAEPLEELPFTTDDFSIVREGDEFIVSGPFEPAGDEQLTGGAELGAVMTFSVTFPGAVAEHNGTLEGTTVTWDLLDPPDELYARGAATEGGGFPVLVLILAGLALIGAAVVAIVFVARRPASFDDDEDARLAPPEDPTAPPEDPTAP